MSSGSSTTQSSPPPQTTVHGPRSVLVLAVGCTVFGLFFWFLYGQLQPSGENDETGGTSINREDDSETEKKSPAGSDSKILENSQREATAEGEPKQDTRPSSRTPQSSPPSGAESHLLEEIRRETAELKQLQLEVAQQLKALRVETTARQVERDLQQARLSTLRRAGAEVDELLDELRKEYTDWTAFQKALMTDDRGRRIAQNTAQVEAVAGILARQQITNTTIDAWQNDLDLRLRAIRSETTEVTVNVSAEFRAEMNRLAEAVRRGLEDVRQKHRAVKSILAQAGPVPPGSDAPTLGDAIENFRNRRDEQREAFLKAEADRVREEYTQKLAEQIRRTEKRRGEDALEDARRAEARRQATLDAARKREDLERDFVADMPKIKRYLIPFITDGYSQPNFLNQKRNTGKKGPVSLSGLRSAGCFVEGIQGLTKLNEMALIDGNDRPNGGFRRRFGGGLAPEDTAFVKTAQQLLIKYGELMVEKGMLAP